MAVLVLAHYVVLRSVLRSQPELRRCLTRCRHCRIFFLTDPRNAWRCDLGCPFGCREAHDKQQSNRRSAAYYRTEEGRGKKRDLNAKRRKGAGIRPLPEPEPVAEAASPWPRAILDYVCMVVSLIEGRRVTLAEVVEMLARAVRQHRMGRERRIDQAVAALHERPP